MAKPEWGTKRTCQSCGVKFYDFARNPIECPSCGAVFDVEASLKLKRGRTPPPADTPKKPPPEPVAAADEKEEETEDLEAVEEDDGVLEDTSDLDDEDAVVPEVPVKSGDDERAV